MAFFLPLVFLAIIIVFSSLLVLLVLIFFGSTKREIAWLVTMSRIKNSPKMVEKECTISVF